MAPIRIGIVGCGVIGRVHAERLARLPGAQVAGVTDPVTTSAKAVAQDYFPDAVVSPGVDDMIQSVALDALVLCSPTSLHHQQAIHALEHGLHVLCEKPLATDRYQIEAMIDASKRFDRLLSVAYQRRYQALYLTARRELLSRTEQYGAIKQVHLFVCERWAQTIEGTWRNDPQVGSGYFGDAGTHQIDSIFFMTDQYASSVNARSDRRGFNVEIVTQVQAQLSKGARLMAHFVGDAHHWREDIHFHCEKADLLLRDHGLYRCADNEVTPIKDLEAESDPDTGFVEALQRSEPTNSPAECALPMWSWTDAVMRSIRSGTSETCL